MTYLVDDQEHEEAGHAHSGGYDACMAQESEAEAGEVGSVVRRDGPKEKVYDVPTGFSNAHLH